MGASRLERSERKGAARTQYRLEGKEEQAKRMEKQRIIQADLQATGGMEWVSTSAIRYLRRRGLCYHESNPLPDCEATSRKELRHLHGLTRQWIALENPGSGQDMA